jgi:hypothetical protein
VHATRTVEGGAGHEGDHPCGLGTQEFGATLPGESLTGSSPLRDTLLPANRWSPCHLLMGL